MEVKCCCKMFESGGEEVRLQCSDAAIAVPYDRTQCCRNAFFHLHFAHRSCAFCHLIGVTGEFPKSDSCTKMEYE